MLVVVAIMEMVLSVMQETVGVKYLLLVAIVTVEDVND